MGPPSYMRPFIDRNVVMRRMTVATFPTGWEREKEREIFARLVFYTAWNGSLLPAIRDNLSVSSSTVKRYVLPSKMGPIGCPEASVKKL